jgi:fatty acid desaturase
MGALSPAQVQRITAPLDRSRMTFLESRTTMEFTALFLAVTIVMLAAWWGTRALALALFAVTLVACVATYLHHASDVLKLSF